MSRVQLAPFALRQTQGHWCLFLGFFVRCMLAAPTTIFFQLYFFLGSFFILPTKIIDALAFAAL